MQPRRSKEWAFSTNPGSPSDCYSGFLAPCLNAFANCGSIVCARDQRERKPDAMTNISLRIELPLYKKSSLSDQLLSLLNCSFNRDRSVTSGIPTTEAWMFNHEYFLRTTEQSSLFSRVSDLKGLYRDSSEMSPVPVSLPFLSDDEWQRGTSVLTIGPSSRRLNSRHHDETEAAASGTPSKRRTPISECVNHSPKTQRTMPIAPILTPSLG